MLDITESVINLFKDHYRQVARITMTKGNTVTVFNESDILQGGLTVDRYCASGNKIELGSAVAAELNLKIKNDDGKYDDLSFEGAELYVEIGIKKWDAHRWENAQLHYVPFGYFIIDTPPRTLSTISINALDRMVKFDKAVNAAQITFPITVENLVKRVCELCGVNVAISNFSTTDLVNTQYSITTMPTGENLTYRKLIQWCAFLMGSCAFINEEGKLDFKWYTTTDEVINPSDRYSSDMLENNITITGLKYQSNAGQLYEYGTDSYRLEYIGCDLLQANASTALTNIYNKINGLSYRPYKAEIRSMPHLYPLDKIGYKDKNGDVHSTVITNMTYTMNANTQIAGIGETVTVNGYAGDYGSTTQEKLNQLSGNGLYQTKVELPNGSIITYLHDKPILSNSKLIITITAEGMSISNDGGTTVEFSFNFVTGAAIAHTLTVDNAWVTALFAEDITATGTITGASLLGSTLKTDHDVSGNHVEIIPGQVIAFSTDEFDIDYTNHSNMLPHEHFITIAENTDPTLDVGFAIQDRRLNNGFARLKTVPLTDALGNHTQALAFNGCNGGGNNQYMRIQETLTGTESITVTSMNDEYGVYFKWENDPTVPLYFSKVPFVSASVVGSNNPIDVIITYRHTGGFNFKLSSATSLVGQTLSIQWFAIS